MRQSVFIILDANGNPVRAVAAGTGGAVSHTQKQLTPYDLSVGFSSGGAEYELANVSSVSLSFKRADRFDPADGVTQAAALRLNNPNPTTTGSGAGTRYEFLTRLQSPLLQSDMAAAASVAYDVEITWTIEGSEQTYKSGNFTLSIESAVYGEVETPPTALTNTNRLLQVDPNWEFLQSQGFSAHVDAQTAVDAAFALATPPSATDPVQIKIGIMTAGDVEIPSTGTSVVMVIEGVSRQMSRLNTLSFADWASGDDRRVILKNLLIDEIVGAYGVVELDNCTVTDWSAAQRDTEILGDTLTVMESVDASATAGTAGSAGVAGTAATAGNDLTFRGSLTVTELTSNAASGGDGFNAADLVDQGTDGGHAARGGDIKLYDQARVLALYTYPANGGDGGSSTGDGLSGGDGGNGAARVQVTISPHTYVGAYFDDSPSIGAGGNGGASTGTGGTAGTDGTDAAGTKIDVRGSSPIIVPPLVDAFDGANSFLATALYSDGDDLVKQHVDNTTEVLGTGGGSAITYSAGFLRVTVDGTTYEFAAVPV